MLSRADQLAILREEAWFGAVRGWQSQLLSVENADMAARQARTYSALSTTTAASCARPRGSSCATLTFGLDSSASLIVLSAASRSRVSYLGFGKEEIRFQTLGKADLSRPG